MIVRNKSFGYNKNKLFHYSVTHFAAFTVQPAAECHVGKTLTFFFTSNVCNVDFLFLLAPNNIADTSKRTKQRIKTATSVIRPTQGSYEATLVSKIEPTVVDNSPSTKKRKKCSPVSGPKREKTVKNEPTGM